MKIFTTDETISFQKSDFPENFINNQNPDDFKSRSDPITEFIFHRRTDHNRLFLRICFEISESILYLLHLFLIQEHHLNFILIQLQED